MISNFMKALFSMPHPTKTAAGLVLFFAVSAFANPYQTPSAPAHSWSGGGQGRGWNRTPQFTPGPGAIIAKPQTVRPPMSTVTTSAANAAAMTSFGPNPVAGASTGPEFVDVEKERLASGASELRSHLGFAVEGALARDPGELLAKRAPVVIPETAASHSATLPRAVEKDGKPARKSDK
jgi:hypothetical protein